MPTLYTGLAYLVLVGAVAAIVISDGANLSSLGPVLLLMLRSLSYGQSLQVSMTSISSALPSLDMLQERLDHYRAGEVIDEGAPIGSIGPLTLDGVRFEYTEGEAVLHGIDAEIRAGEIIGIVGPSGGGKSTLVQLLLGLRQPTSGRILADGRDICTLARTEWARKVTFVPQAAHLVGGTIADNIRFYRDGVTQDDIEHAARLASLHDDVMGFPERYERSVGERGDHLSGGQQQRLCIARALVERPDVLILDEPTSSLDVRSEALIRSTLAELGRRMTVIVIAHRMSTLDICDRLMVIQDGVLKAFDTPTQLEHTSDFYLESLVLSGLKPDIPGVGGRRAVIVHDDVSVTWLFDCDGVLLDSNAVKTAAFAAAVAPYGDDVVRNVVEHHVANGGISRYAKFDRLFAEVLERPPEPGERDRVLGDFADAALAGLYACEADPHAAELLDEIRAAVRAPTW